MPARPAARVQICLVCEPSATDSPMPSGRRHTTRTPCGPSSPASWCERASTAAHAGLKPSVGMVTRAAVVDIVRMTPAPWRTMCRAAVVAVRNWVVV